MKRKLIVSSKSQRGHSFQIESSFLFLMVGIYVSLYFIFIHTYFVPQNVFYVALDLLFGIEFEDPSGNQTLGPVRRGDHIHPPNSRLFKLFFLFRSCLFSFNVSVKPELVQLDEIHQIIIWKIIRILWFTWSACLYSRSFSFIVCSYYLLEERTEKKKNAFSALPTFFFKIVRRGIQQRRGWTPGGGGSPLHDTRSRLYLWRPCIWSPHPLFFPPHHRLASYVLRIFFFPLIFPEYRESLVSSFMTDIKLLFPPYIHTPLPCGRPSLTASGREFSFSSSMIAKKKKKEKKNMAKIMNVGLFAIDRDTIPCLRKALLVQLKVALHTPPFWLCSATSV